MTSAIRCGLFRGGKIPKRGARAGPLLMRQSRRLATPHVEGAVPAIAMLLKCLRLYHISAEAAHHQVDVIVCWTVAVYVHICLRDRVHVKFRTGFHKLFPSLHQSLPFTFFAEGHGLRVFPPIFAVVFSDMKHTHKHNQITRWMDRQTKPFFYNSPHLSLCRHIPLYMCALYDLT